MTGPLYRRHHRWHPPARAPDYKILLARSPRLVQLSVQGEASELTGPTLGHGDIDAIDNNLIVNSAKTGDTIGERILVHGRALEDDARPVPNTLLEIGQANADAR